MASGKGTIHTYPPGSLLREAGILLLITLLLATLTWVLRPPRLPQPADLAVYEMDLGFPVMDPVEAMAGYDDNTLIFVDTRSPDPLAPRIPGAFSISQARFEEDLLEAYDFLMPEDPLLLFGDGNLLLISAVASRLQEKGFTDITLMSEGVEGWREAGGDLAETEEAGDE